MAFKIYTKTGDQGKTSLFGGTKLSKSNIRIHAYGTVDELNSWMGVIHAELEDEEYQKEIHEIQSRLFDLGSHLASDPDKQLLSSNLTDSDLALMENRIDQMTADLPELKNFILPGGDKQSAQVQVARTVCRRAERFVVELSQHADIESIVIQYLNRLSDYLFTLARYISFQNGSKEVLWKSRNKI